MFAGVYQGRRVLVTGHTGFKGSWLCAWLVELGAQVAGFSVNVPTVPANFAAIQLKERITDFVGDIRDLTVLQEAMAAFDPEIVFHLAAQSIVRRSFAEQVQTFDTNAVGTVNVLEGCRRLPQIKSASSLPVTSVIAMWSGRGVTGRMTSWAAMTRTALLRHAPRYFFGLRAVLLPD